MFEDLELLCDSMEESADWNGFTNYSLVDNLLKVSELNIMFVVIFVFVLI